ncbi:Ff.00g011760.m01.CDS01 [Fusarium sp. VM40]|nr:Ff.00g011760.m01.CDS01 [Fusarium sp. VM40]
MEERPRDISCSGPDNTATSTDTPHEAILRAQEISQKLVKGYCEQEDTGMLSEIIHITKEALAATDQDHPELLHPLAWALYKKYKDIALEWKYLEEAVTIQRRAFKSTTSSSSDHQKYSYWLALMLGDCFYHTGQVADLEDAIELIQTLLQQLPDKAPMVPVLLVNLGMLFKEKYVLLGTEEDFSNARGAMYQAFAIAAKNGNEDAQWLEIASDIYDARYTWKGSLEDLEQVSRLRKKCLAATPEDREIDKCARQVKLATTLENIHTKKGDVSALRESIGLTEEAMSASEESDPELLCLTRHLSFRLYLLYLEAGGLEDLEQAIRLGEEFLTRCDKDDSKRSSQLIDTAAQLAALYERTGILGHLEEAINMGREGLEKTSRDSSDLILAHGNLGASLSSRSQATGSLVDLEEAVTHARAALDITPEDCPTRHNQLHNLASVLLKKFIRVQDDVMELDEAIALSREAVASVPKDHPDLATYLNRLMGGLNKRHDKRGSYQDLEEGIQIGRQTVGLTKGIYNGRAFAVSTFAVLLKKRFKAEGSLSDLDEAIEVSKTALNQTPRDSPSRTEHWKTLGDLFVGRNSKTRDDRDISQAVESYRAAVDHTVGQPLRRIIAAASAMPYCQEYQDAYDIGRTAIALIPSLIAARSLETIDRQHLLSHTSGLTVATVGAAVKLKKEPSEVLGLLEQGRGVLGSSLGEMRSDIKELQQDFPGLAEEFTRLRDELDYSTHVDTISQASPSRSNDGDHRRIAAKSFDELLLEIRQKAGFEDFLGPLSTEQILAAAAYGPIVVINSSWMGCQAIVIQEKALTTLGFRDLKEYEIIDRATAGDFGSVETLEFLWDHITGPVLEVLGLTGTPVLEQDWSHVWWIPTGPISRFPLHASGRHQERSGKTVMDRVISSYSTSLKALVRGRRQRGVISGPSQALLVAMEQTPGQDPLPKARDEIDVVSSICSSMAVRPVTGVSDKKNALSYLRDCNIFHFAGHGNTDSDNPSKSYLCFDTKDHLTVGDLLALNLHERSPFLAYLSACSTGHVQDDKFIDESIHLISACQLAGFRHVIGTLWKVQDDHCVDVARVTYGCIKDGGMTDESVCRGLHKATRILRDAWLHGISGEKEPVVELVEGDRDARTIYSCEEPKLVSAYWAPYVHFGV